MLLGPSRSGRCSHSQPSSSRQAVVEYKSAMKMLIPSNIAGCLIGKGGCIISQMQALTGSKIKLSQNHEFFPGTTDRVCLITAPSDEGVLNAIMEMLRRLAEVRADLPPSHCSFASWQLPLKKPCLAASCPPASSSPLSSTVIQAHARHLSSQVAAQPPRPCKETALNPLSGPRGRRGSRSSSKMDSL
jgi:hypothetical protein